MSWLARTTLCLRLQTGLSCSIHIKAASDDNARFRDGFLGKDEVEKHIHRSLHNFLVDDDDGNSNLSSRHVDVLHFVVERMTEYGYAADRIALIFDCANNCRNAYINKQLSIQLRAINRLLRQNQHVPSELFDQLEQLAITWNPQEVAQRAPLDEVIQIFC